MPRGRKKTSNPLDELISIRITKEHKELLKKNKNIKKEIDIMVRDLLDVYSNK